MTDKIVVFSTCSSEDEAEKIARSVVGQRLAACVTVVPRVRSFYRWKGEIQSSEEHLLVIKSSRERMADLIAALEKEHSYEVPEVLALPVVEGSENYLNWLQANLGSEPA
jgi:periplasmic divalent cation tolerance protein